MTFNKSHLLGMCMVTSGHYCHHFFLGEGRGKGTGVANPLWRRPCLEETSLPDCGQSASNLDTVRSDITHDHKTVSAVSGKSP